MKPTMVAAAEAKWCNRVIDGGYREARVMVCGDGGRSGDPRGEQKQPVRVSRGTDNDELVGCCEVYLLTGWTGLGSLEVRAR